MEVWGHHKNKCIPVSKTVSKTDTVQNPTSKTPLPEKPDVLNPAILLMKIPFSFQRHRGSVGAEANCGSFQRNLAHRGNHDWQWNFCLPHRPFGQVHVVYIHSQSLSFCSFQPCKRQFCSVLMFQDWISGDVFDSVGCLWVRGGFK